MEIALFSKGGFVMKVFKDKKANIFVSSTKVGKRKVFSQGRTRDEAIKALVSAVTLFVKVHAKRGTLAHVL